MSQTYVRAAHAMDQGGGITGTVLHLAVWVRDDPKTTLGLGTGRWMPVCGGRGRQVQWWRITGPWAGGWHGHAHWPLCSRCADELHRLTLAGAQQMVRHGQGPTDG